MKEKDEKQVKNYDFTRPAKFSKEHLRTLEIIFEHYGRLLSTNLPVYLRKTVQVEVMNSEVRYKHSCNSNPDTVDRVYDTGYDTECDQIPHSLIPDVTFTAKYEASLDWEVDTLTNYHCNHVCTEVRQSSMCSVIADNVPFESLSFPDTRCYLYCEDRKSVV